MKLEEQLENEDLRQGQYRGNLNTRLQGNIVGCFSDYSQVSINGISKARLI